MPAILRIDVDKTFLEKKSFTNNLSFKRKLDQRNLTDESCFSFSTGFLFGKKKKCMIKDLNSRGMKESLFFQPFTVPNRDFAQELLKKGHSVGLHAVHTRDYKDFSRDLTKISRSFDGKVYGFTKHGSGKFNLSRRHGSNNLNVCNKIIANLYLNLPNIG